MIDYPKLVEFLKEKTGLGYYNSSNTELICRCPTCEPESKKTHGHLYIKIPSNKNELPVYNCFKSDECKGTLIKLIKTLKADPRDFISEETLKFRFAEKEYDYYKKDLIGSKYKLTKPDYDSYKLKRMYLYSRLGFDFDLDRVPGLILNIREFIQSNNIDLKNRSRFLEYYETSFIGFVSDLGSLLILRNIDPSSEQRYIKIPLNDKQLLFRDVYSITTGKSKKETNTIVLCEGIFDLLVGINSFELNELKSKSCLWVSILGNNYPSIVPAALNKCKLTASNFVILSDNDRKEIDYRYFKYNPSVIGFDIYRNKFGKDFGKLPIGLSKHVFDFGRW